MVAKSLTNAGSARIRPEGERVRTSRQCGGGTQPQEQRHRGTVAALELRGGTTSSLIFWDTTHEGPRPRLRSGPFVVKSGDANVLRLRTLGAGGDVELDLLVLIERLVTARLDRGEVDEYVLAAAVL